MQPPLDPLVIFKEDKAFYKESWEQLMFLVGLVAVGLPAFIAVFQILFVKIREDRIIKRVEKNILNKIFETFDIESKKINSNFEALRKSSIDYVNRNVALSFCTQLFKLRKEVIFSLRLGYID